MVDPYAADNKLGFLSTLDGYEDLNHMFDIAFGIVSMIFMPIIIIGNLLVIISFFKFKRLQKTTGMFICSLALSDLLLGLAHGSVVFIVGIPAETRQRAYYTMVDPYAADNKLGFLFRH
jgi:hypothetical protein